MNHPDRNHAGDTAPTPARPMLVVSDGSIDRSTAERLLPLATMLSLRLDALAGTSPRHRSDHGWNGRPGDARTLSNVRDARLVTTARTIGRNLRLAWRGRGRDHDGVTAPWSVRDALALPWPITVIVQEDDLAEFVMDGTTRDGIRIGDADNRGRRTLHDLAIRHHARIVGDAALCLKAVADDTAITTAQADAVIRTTASEMLGHAGTKDVRGVGMRMGDGIRPAALTGMDASGTMSLREAPANPFVRHGVAFKTIGMKEGIIRTRTPFLGIRIDGDPIELLRLAVVDAEVRDHARRIGAMPA